MTDVKTVTGAYRFSLCLGEIVKIGGIPYCYDGDGHLRGATDPTLARNLRDHPSSQPAIQAPPDQ